MANNHAEDVSRRSHGEASDSGWHEKRLVGNELYDWADFPGGLNKAVAKLANMALKEDWEFGATQDRTKPLPILHAYLRYTFARLKIESDKGQRNKLCYAENGLLAAFNTGLVNEDYDDIHGVFTWSSEIKKWRFEDFCTRHEGGLGDRFARLIPSAPVRARYFDKDNIDDLIYTAPADQFPEIKWEHVIRDGIARNRYPVEFLRTHCPKRFAFTDPRSLSPYRPTRDTMSDREIYLAELAAAVWEDHDTVQAIIKNKLEKTLKRVAWNFRAAIPMWFPSFDKMSLLLPVALTKGRDGEDHIDIALVVEKTGPDSYRGQTVLSLYQAYQDARLVCRPESDWLRPDLIGVEDDDGAEGAEEHEGGNSVRGPEIVNEPTGRAPDPYAVGTVHVARVTGFLRSTFNGKVNGIFLELAPGERGLCLYFRSFSEQKDTVGASLGE